VGLRWMFINIFIVLASELPLVLSPQYKYGKCAFAFGNEVLSEKTIFGWNNDFIYDRISFSNDLRGQVSAVTEENKASV
jgi:hypothetical protein